MFWVILANLLCVAFTFMINDVEDAQDDARDTAKAKRNPISAGLLSKNLGYFFTILTAALSAIIFYFLGPIPFWLGITCLLISASYSWRILRLKAIPVIDLLSHGLMLAGLQLLCAYYVINPYTGIHYDLVAPFIFVVAISVRGQLFNQVRDFECDIKAGIRHTTSIIGIKTAHFLMTALLTLAVIMFLHSLIIKIIPLWIFLIMAILGVFFLKKPLIEAKKSRGLALTYNFQNPVLYIGLISFTIWTITRFF